MSDMSVTLIFHLLRPKGDDFTNDEMHHTADSPNILLSRSFPFNAHPTLCDLVKLATHPVPIPIKTCCSENKIAASNEALKYKQLPLHRMRNKIILCHSSENLNEVESHASV